MNPRECSSVFSVSSCKKTLLLKIFEQEVTEGANWRDLRAAHWLTLNSLNEEWMNPREAPSSLRFAGTSPPFPLFPPVKTLLLKIFEQEVTEWVNWRDLRAAHWLTLNSLNEEWMNQREAPPFPLFPPVKTPLLKIFEQEVTEWVNWRDLRADHWLNFKFLE
jgi:hypothetical protein